MERASTAVTDLPRWIFLSPHLDDAVLSCGGLIAALRHDARVEVWTVFSSAPTRGPYSHSAQWLHGASGGVTGSRLARLRRREDREALNLLGATPRYLKWTDAAYRKTSGGKFLYRSILRARWHAEDQPMVSEIGLVFARDIQPADTVIAPLGLGGHVDHLIVRQAAESLDGRHVLYYPDIPYVQTRIDKATPEASGLWRFDYALSSLEVLAWVDSLSCYKSQLELLQEGSGPLPKLVDQLADTNGLALLAKSREGAPEVSRRSIFSKPAFIPTAAEGLSRSKVTPRAVSRFDIEDIPDWSSSPLAPIVVFAFRRLDLLRETIGALERCDGFSESPKHVYSDAPRLDDATEVADVAEVRAWLREWCIDHDAILHEAPVNQGLRRSILGGVTELLQTSERVIVLEDDILVAKPFLVFMNQALESYQDRDDIVQVSGYNVPFTGKLPTIGLLRVPGSWGWATWQRAWKHYNDDAPALLARVKEMDTKKFDMGGTYGHLEALERNADGSLNTWLVRWYASIFVQGGLTVYPSLSFVRNIGFGEAGENCKPGPTATVFANQRIRKRRVSPDWKSIGSAETPQFAEALAEFYKWQNHLWTKPSTTDRVRSFVQRLLRKAPVD